MRLFLTSLFLFTIFAIPARWYYVCQIRHNCEPIEAPLPTRATTLKLMDGDSTILEGYEQFSFPQGSVQPEMNENNQKYLQALADYLTKNREKNVTITGHIRKIEAGKSAGIFENLGTARAGMIEQMLENLGIDESRITIDHKLDDNDDLSEPLSFNLYIPEGSPDDYAKLEFRFENMTYSDANFETDSDTFDPGIACLNYIDSLQTYYAQNPEMALIITGHADSRGTEEHNYDLGLRRAKNTKKYIEENYDISTDIATESMGEKDPFVSNLTEDGKPDEEGMKKNRRVNFRIIQKDIEENNN